MLSKAVFRSKTPSKQNQAVAELKEILKRAEQAKINAIDEENYALAKQARRAEIQLDLILKQIRDVERAKQRAIDEDDFDRAQELTDQIRVLRDNAFEQVDIKFLNNIPVSYILSF
jgi:Holliday junction resolvasome RuvABC ATP-dependent DNA helicase subunit